MTSNVLVDARASGAKSVRNRKALAISTAMAAGLLASPMVFYLGGARCQ